MNPRARRPVGPARLRASRAVKCTAAASAFALVLSAAAAQAAPQLQAIVIHDPPAAGHLVSAFPARDFVSAEGYRVDETYTVEVHHSPVRGGAVVSSQSGIRPDDQGLVEVNHPGGACWVGVTPNIVAGDVVRVIVDSSPDPARVGVADQTMVADVTASRPANPAPGTIVVHGTAKAADGSQFPLDQLEARLVAPGKAFDLGGKRAVRAPGAPGSSLRYDAADSTSWTATWTGLSDHDVTLALGAQSMGSWLGRDPAANNETTVYETGAGIAGGPQAPCTAPKEKLPPAPGQDAVAPSVPQNLTAEVSDVNSVTLTWDPSADNQPDAGVTNYGVYRNGVPIFTVQNADGSAPAPTTFVDTNVPPGCTVTLCRGCCGGTTVEHPDVDHAGARPVWLGLVLDDAATDDVATWIRTGGPGPADPPAAIDLYAFEPSRRVRRAAPR